MLYTAAQANFYRIHRDDMLLYTVSTSTGERHGVWFVHEAGSSGIRSVSSKSFLLYAGGNSHVDICRSGT